MKQLLSVLFVLCALSVLGADAPVLRQRYTTNAEPPIATYTSNGVWSTNGFLTAQSTAQWQRNAERLPWRAIVCNADSDASNKVVFIRSWPNPLGFNIMMCFEQFYATNRTAGHLTINLTNFPMGLEPYREFLHTNGFRLGMWYDSANATQEGYASKAQFIDDIQTIANVFKPEVLWIDETEYDDRALIAAAILSTNVNPIELMFGSSFSTSLGLLQPKPIALANGWRLHGSTDVNSFIRLLEYFDLMESNGWKYVGPGQFTYFGPESAYPGTATENATSIAGQAMIGGAFMYSFNAVIGPITTMTNQRIREIQWDNAMVAARRVFQTNGLWIYLKPLGTPSGPEYELFVMNTNAGNSIVTPLVFSQLNKKFQQGYMGLSYPTYTVVNDKSGAFVGTDQTSVSVPILAGHDYALYRLTPKLPNFGVYDIVVQACPTPTGTWTPTTSTLGIYDATVATTNTSVSRLAFPVPHGNGFTNCAMRISLEGQTGIFNNTLFSLRFQTQVLLTNGTLTAGPAVDTNIFLSAGKVVVVTANVSFVDDVSPRQAIFLPFWSNGFTNAGVSQPLWVVGIQAMDLP